MSREVAAPTYMSKSNFAELPSLKSLTHAQSNFTLRQIIVSLGDVSHNSISLALLDVKIQFPDAAVRGNHIFFYYVNFNSRYLDY